MCECYQIGGRFIAEDPDCPVHGRDNLPSQIERLQSQRDDLLGAAISAVNQCIRLGSQYGTDGHSHNEALAQLQEAIRKATE